MKKIPLCEYEIAYFSMEIALENSIKTYSGGLGILAGDTLRSAADLEVPIIGITLLNDQGYFKQKINKDGKQAILPVHYKFDNLKKLKPTVHIIINNEIVKLRAWRYDIIGNTGFVVPVFLLDTNIKSNSPTYAELTGQLYRAGDAYRLMQEIVLGRGGVKIIKTLGCTDIKKYHLNEGHATFAAIELLKNAKGNTLKQKTEEVKNKCVFTTHTPVEAGHDTFEKTLVKEYFDDFPFNIPQLIDKKRHVNMTLIGLHFSNYVNGVAIKHKEISLKMFPEYEINAITNGVHSLTWTAPAFQKLYTKTIPSWKKSSFSFRNAFRIHRKDIWKAHMESKKTLINYVNKKYKEKLDIDVFTIGFARRFATYKRAWLVLSDMEKLLKIHKKYPIQFIFAGKAHPADKEGQKLIANLFAIKKEYKDRIQITFIEGYDMTRAKLITSGVDLWLNTPLPPYEASGTSGMKAAHNGVPQLSTLDGWWIEGHIEGRTGWYFGRKGKHRFKKVSTANKDDAKDLYHKLKTIILPLYYDDPEQWKHVMRNCIAINASFFNTHRMVQQYIQEAYFVD